MSGVPRTDGSVTAGGNTLIIWNLVFTLLHTLTFTPFDISSGKRGVTFQELRSVLSCVTCCKSLSQFVCFQVSLLTFLESL